MDLTGKRAIVTGATSGIGWATAHALKDAGATVICIGRRKDRLKKLNAEGFDVLELDVNNQKGWVKFVERHKEFADVDILVNNAGLAVGTDPLQSASFDDWKAMIETNVTALLGISGPIMAIMAKKGSGHIVNLGSVAGRWVYPGGAVYCATKAAVGAITEGMRFDLHGTGVRVTNIEPGLVETEFSMVRFKGDKQKAEAIYNTTKPLAAADIADAILYAVTRPKHVNIQEMVIFPTDQASVRDVIRNEAKA